MLEINEQNERNGLSECRGTSYNIIKYRRFFLDESESFYSSKRLKFTKSKNDYQIPKF